MLLRHADYIWRLAVTGVAFAAIGIGGCGLAATIIPAAGLFSRDKLTRMRRAQAIIRASFRLYVWILQKLGVISLQVTGADKLAQCRGRLIIANHPTLLDIVLIMSLVPRAKCVVKHQLWRNPFFRPVFSATGYIRNDEQVEAFVTKCKETLQAGNNLIVFPEGTRSIPGQPLRLQRGFAQIAALSNADLQLITIKCHPITLTKGAPWYSIPEHRPYFRIEVDELIDITRFVSYRTRSIGVRKLVSYIQSYYYGKLRHG